MMQMQLHNTAPKLNSECGCNNPATCGSWPGSSIALEEVSKGDCPPETLSNGFFAIKRLAEVL